MDIDEAIYVLSRNAPCDHHADALVESGFYWQCESCGLKFRKESLERHRKATKEYLDAVSAVRDALLNAQNQPEPPHTFPPKTLRDEFAMVALQGLFASDAAFSNDALAREAYRLADAMMEARNGSS